MHDVINTSQLIYVSQPTACAHHKPCLLTFLFVGSNGRLRNKRTLLLLFYFKQCRIHPSPSIRSQPTTPHARTPSLSYKQLVDHSKNREAPSRYKVIYVCSYVTDGLCHFKKILLFFFSVKQCRIRPSPSIRSQPTTPHARTPSLSYKQLVDHSKNREAPSRYKVIYVCSYVTDGLCHFKKFFFFFFSVKQCRIRPSPSIRSQPTTPHARTPSLSYKQLVDHSKNREAPSRYKVIYVCSYVTDGLCHFKKILLFFFSVKQCRIRPSPSIRSQPTTPHARTPSLSYKQLVDHSKNREAPSRYKVIYVCSYVTDGLCHFKKFFFFFFSVKQCRIRPSPSIRSQPTTPHARTPSLSYKQLVDHSKNREAPSRYKVIYVCSYVTDGLCHFKKILLFFFFFG